MKGAGSFFLPALRSSHTEGGTIDGRYCYNLFLHHYSHVRPFFSGGMPRVVAELGPGSSLGMGLAALLAGADHYIALDLEQHRNTERDLDVLEGLVDLFRNETEPEDEPFPPPASKRFPPELSARLNENLARDRVERIRKDLIDRTGTYVRYVAPWTDTSCIASDSIDWLFSHAVLEHVDEVSDAYASMRIWLKADGLTSHLIDFCSHFLTAEWNGHWAINKPLWNVIRGKRPYLINRAWRSKHLDLLTRHGFEKLDEVLYVRDDGLPRKRFVSEFSGMQDGDARTQMTFVVARKTGSGLSRS